MTESKENICTDVPKPTSELNFELFWELLVYGMEREREREKETLTRVNNSQQEINERIGKNLLVYDAVEIWHLLTPKQLFVFLLITTAHRVSWRYFVNSVSKVELLKVFLSTKARWFLRIYDQYSRDCSQVLNNIVIFEWIAFTCCDNAFISHLIRTLPSFKRTLEGPGRHSSPHPQVSEEHHVFTEFL